MLFASVKMDSTVQSQPDATHKFVTAVAAAMMEKFALMELVRILATAHVAATLIVKLMVWLQFVHVIKANSEVLSRNAKVLENNYVVVVPTRNVKSLMVFHQLRNAIVYQVT